jgi:hypothetical protein
MVVVVRPSGGMREVRGWVRDKTTETERVCSVSGVPCETAVGRGEVGWWGGVVAMAVVVRPSGGMCKVGEWVCTKKDKTERTRSVSGVPCKTSVGRGEVG